MSVSGQELIVLLVVLLALAYLLRRIGRRLRRDSTGCPTGCHCPVRPRPGRHPGTSTRRVGTPEKGCSPPYSEDSSAGEDSV